MCARSVPDVCDRGLFALDLLFTCERRSVIREEPVREQGSEEGCLVQLGSAMTFTSTGSRPTA